MTKNQLNRLQNKHSEMSKQVDMLEKNRNTNRTTESKIQLNDLKKQKLLLRDQIEKAKLDG
jgi:uncharacterized protein YdcH (DUF465 family)